MNNSNFTIISFYKFRRLSNLAKLKNTFEKFCVFNKLRGTILFAPEGINVSIAGLSGPIQLFKQKIRSHGFSNLELKYSYYKFMPFNRLKIKIKKEIITFSKSKLDVENNTAIHVNPNEWNKLIRSNKTLILDVRNNFEYNMGSFKNSVNPQTINFTEFKKFVKNMLNPKSNNKIAMFCTGGIRCEKASSYMLNKGFKNLYQLKGGILNYLKEVPKIDSTWKGECFVFDNRVSIKNGFSLGTYQLCHGCRIPLSKKDRKSNKYESGVCCSKCFNIISSEKKKRLRERNKQIEIAKKRGIYNPYLKQTPLNFL